MVSLPPANERGNRMTVKELEFFNLPVNIGILTYWPAVKDICSIGLDMHVSGNDITYLCDVIDELESILRDVQHSSPVSVQNTIERRLLAAMTKKSP